MSWMSIKNQRRQRHHRHRAHVFGIIWIFHRESWELRAKAPIREEDKARTKRVRIQNFSYEIKSWYFHAMSKRMHADDNNKEENRDKKVILHLSMFVENVWKWQQWTQVESVCLLSSTRAATATTVLTSIAYISFSCFCTNWMLIEKH